MSEAKDHEQIYISNAQFPKIAIRCGDTLRDLREIIGTGKFLKLAPLSI